MPHNQRAFAFEGSDEDYIAFLETQLSAALDPNSGRTFPPSPSISTQDEDLKIFYYDPVAHCDREHLESNGSVIIPQPRHSPGIPFVEPQGLKELRSFITDVGNIHSWENKKREIGLSSSSTNQFAVQALRGQATTSSICEPGGSRHYPSIFPPDKEVLIRRGCEYGALAHERELHGDLILHLAKFQQLIFVSLCSVMIYDGTPKEVVNWMMRRYVSDTTPENLKRLRLGSIWVNRCIADLLEKGWGFRSWEVFLLCQFSPLRIALILTHLKILVRSNNTEDLQTRKAVVQSLQPR